MALWWLYGGYVFPVGQNLKIWLLSHIWPWRSRSIAPQNFGELNQGILHLWSKFDDPSLNGWWVMVRTSSKWGKFGLSSQIWPWRSRSISPQNNRDLNQGLLHLWSKFGDPSLNGSRVIARTSKWLTHRQTDRHTHTQTQATTIPEGQNWPRVKMVNHSTFLHTNGLV